VKELPAIMGVESEIREALTNLIFNAVDAMPMAARSHCGRDSRRMRPEKCIAGTRLRGSERHRHRHGWRWFYAWCNGTARKSRSERARAGDHDAPDLSVVRAITPGPARAEAGRVVPSRLRILAVDDDPLLLQSLRNTWKTDGHIVIIANGGQAGIDAFRAAQERDGPFSQGASLAEIRSLLAEGRVGKHGRMAKRGTDAFVAAAQLGFDRGITSFQRTGFFKGRIGGDNYFTAIDQGRITPRRNQKVDLLRDADDWIAKLTSASLATNARLPLQAQPLFWNGGLLIWRSQCKITHQVNSLLCLPRLARQNEHSLKVSSGQLKALIFDHFTA
jgi:hypothetical protein